MNFTDDKKVDSISFETKKTEMCVHIERYLADKAKRSERTFIGYRSDTEQFIQKVFGKALEEVTATDMNSLDYIKVSNYFDELYEETDDRGERMYKNTSINRKLSSLSSLLKILYARDHIALNLKFLDLIDTLPDDTVSIAHMDVAVVKEFLNQARFEKFKNEEKQAIIILAVDSGLRTEELLSLNSNNFTDKGDKIVISGRGKGNKPFDVAISELTYERIMTLLKYPKNKLFSLSPKNLRDMMERLKEQLGYENINYSFHSFRKSAITFTYEIAGILEAQKKAHHKSIDTTNIYIKDYGLFVTGSFSVENGVKQDLYKSVDDVMLREVISKLNPEMQLIINSKINEELEKEEEGGY